MSFHLVLASLAGAETQLDTAANVSSTSGSSASSIATLSSMVGGLIVVLVLIFFLAYLVKRFNLVPSSQGVLKTIAVTPLGQKEKLVLVEVGGQQYLLGVTPNQVSLVDKLAQPVEVSTESFATRLKQAKQSQ
ncbi:MULTISPECIES: flagellar biosynthetic protein FliO [Shewanella]|uniref:Flagellar protein n=1 Tax=Shewanella fidelis TaxID=173509 RepID=A0AAW8NP11_9GAMM|nr:MULTISPECIES: flagellar biosynthetic protein FliO [Shewanella]MDR8524461.1 flagellar biosynthetic protein FliO [Shewanella fidelis]MDW4811937.1 flagellar biosynthetic protein FliO [Shewanella fidelis]MDW4817124.1 flagellar biosynthetic protein FliO [Shewanella fidelis]MDW4821194.1 flagellar biosynthetic protein FliO [Shewanella fidelis]MDW4822543.1 flagellar biosynthetic protein FliO [Shewanella fidelis]